MVFIIHFWPRKISAQYIWHRPQHIFQLSLHTDVCFNLYPLHPQHIFTVSNNVFLFHYNIYCWNFDQLGILIDHEHLFNGPKLQHAKRKARISIVLNEWNIPESKLGGQRKISLYVCFCSCFVLWYIFVPWLWAPMELDVTCPQPAT